MKINFNSRPNEILEQTDVQLQRQQLQTQQNIQQIDEQPDKFEMTPRTRKNSKIFKQIITKNKRQMLVYSFKQKLKRNNILAKPPVFTQFKLAKQKKQQKMNALKGINIPINLKLFIQFLYNISIGLLFMLSSFQAFLIGFSQQQTKSRSIIVLKLMCTLLIFIQLLTKCLSSKNQKGLNIQTLKEIGQDNLKSFKFYINIISFVFSVYFNIFNNSSMGIIMFIVCVCNFSIYQDFVRNFQLLYSGTFYTKQLSRLFELFLFNLLFAHFMATVLLSIAYINDQKNWIIVQQLQNSQWYVIYFWSLYWSATIMMTVGFGDITPATWQQAIVVTILQVVAVMILAYVISEVSSIIGEMKQFQTQIDNDLGVFRRMIAKNNIGNDLAHEIQSFLIESGSIKRMFQFQEQKQLLNKLPPRLRKQFLYTTNKSIFLKLPFFQYLHESTLLYFSNEIEGKIYYPGEQINNPKFGYLDAITIVKEGILGLAFKKTNSIYNNIVIHRIHVKTSSDPIMLNIDLIDSTKKLTMQIIAEEYSFCYLLAYQNFIDGLKKYPTNYEYYFTLRHKHKFMQQEWDLSNSCQYCPSMKHTLFQCPKLHYKPIKEYVIQKYLIKNFKQLRDYDRRYLRYFQMRKSNLLRKPLKCWKSVFKATEQFIGLKDMKANHYVLQKKVQHQQLFNNNSCIISVMKNSEYLRVQSINKISENNNGHENMNENMINKVAQQAAARALNNHCCLKHTVQDFNFQNDVAHNYNSYFNGFNPSRLQQISHHFISMGKNIRKHSFKRKNQT